MHSGGPEGWYSAVLSGGFLSGFTVYTSATIDGPKTEVAAFHYSDIDPGRMPCESQVPSSACVGSPRFFRNGLGAVLAGARDIWTAFALSTGWASADQDVQGAKLSLFDGETGVDSLWGGNACIAPGPSITYPSFAWTYDGPRADDVNYWTVTADSDGTDNYCDNRFEGFPNRDFTVASRMRVGWVSTSSFNTGQSGFQVFLRNGATWYYLGEVHDSDYTHHFVELPLPPSRSDVQEIIFRAYESYFSNLYQNDAWQRIHLFSVKLVN